MCREKVNNESIELRAEGMEPRAKNEDLSRRNLSLGLDRKSISRCDHLRIVWLTLCHSPRQAFTRASLHSSAIFIFLCQKLREVVREFQEVLCHLILLPFEHRPVPHRSLGF